MPITKDVHFCSYIAKNPLADPDETGRFANVLKMSNIEHFSAVKGCIMRK
ncbi:MAG TPA: hypothetical protein VN948_22275 [Terriglobales bacterium]|nr:hypothetical protein [Terriglobales bacterium]